LFTLKKIVEMMEAVEEVVDVMWIGPTIVCRLEIFDKFRRIIYTK